MTRDWRTSIKLLGGVLTAPLGAARLSATEISRGGRPNIILVVAELSMAKN